MRVSERMLKNDSLRHLQAAQVAVDTIQEKLSTNKEVNLPSDDPLRYVTAAKFRSAVASKEQYLRNITDVRRSLSDNEAAIDRIRELMQKTRILLVQASNETLTTADTQLIAADVRSSLESLIQFANDQGLDGYFFAGARTDTEPFEVLRDADGEVTDVLYRGDTTARIRAQEDGSTIDTNLVGSRFFQVDPDSATSSFSVQQPGQVIGNVDDNADTVADLASGPTSGFFRVQDQRIWFDTTTDSLLDIADRINDSGADAAAYVRGTLVGADTAPAGTLASAGAATGASAGTITINGSTITIAANATLQEVIDSINGVSDETLVTASVANVAGGYALQLDGGAVIEDIGTGRSDALQRLGVTTGSPVPGNLQSRNPISYSLQVSTEGADQLRLDDEDDNGFLSRLGLTDGSHNAPNNIPESAAVDRTLFAVLVDALDDLETGDTRSLRNDRLPEMDRALERMSGAHADIGARIARLDVAENRESEFILQAKTVIAESEELDISDAVIELRIAQMRLQTAIGAAANPPLNLLNFL